MSAGAGGRENEREKEVEKKGGRKEEGEEEIRRKEEKDETGGIFCLCICIYKSRVGSLLSRDADPTRPRATRAKPQTGQCHEDM
jgi:hypothetical protein